MLLKRKRCELFVSIVWLFAPLFSFAQISWQHSIGSAGSGENAEQHIVHNDYIYVCGYFEQTVTLGKVTLSSRGESDIFLYKAKSDGTIVWAKTFGGPSYDGDVGLGVDTDGNVYLAGGFVDKLYMDNTVLLDATNSYWNSFVSKFDENGNLLWIKGILTESEYSEARIWGNISVKGNSFVIACTFSGSISVDGFLIPGSTFDSYLLIAKFDLSGNMIWHKLPEGVRDCRKIFLDEAGACYLTGPFSGTIKFDGHSLSGNSNYSDVYVVKLDPTGDTQWLKGGIKITSRIDNNWSTSFTIDPSGNLYLIGVFKGDVTFDDFVLHGNTDDEYSIIDTFLVKFSEDGEVLYALNFGDDYHAFGIDIVYSSYGLFVLGMSGTGQYFYTDFNEHTPNSSSPIYINVYGFAGQLTVVDDKKFYISGTADIINSQMANGGRDGILIKLEACTAQAAGKVSEIKGPSMLCPGSELTYSVTAVDNVHHYVWEISGVVTPNGIVMTQGPEITLTVSSAGSGTISVSPENQCNQRTNTKSVSIVVPDHLERPTIVKGDCDKSLSILGGENIEWFLDGALIPESNTNKITNVAAGAYKVRIHNSCYSQESSEVLVHPKADEDELFFPNIITPNDDHKNDSFLLDESLLDSRLKIFNRWGEIVYETDNYQNAWDGGNLSSGVYFYYLENPCYSKPFKGNIYVNK